MKSFTLFAAVLCTIAVSNTQGVTKKVEIADCLKEAGMTREDWTKSCNKGAPTDAAQLVTFKAWVTCTLKAFEIVEETDSGVKIHIEGSPKIAKLENASVIIDSLTKCSDLAKKASTATDAAMAIQTCLFENQKETYVAGCLAAASKL